MSILDGNSWQAQQKHDSASVFPTPCSGRLISHESHERDTET